MSCPTPVNEWQICVDRPNLSLSLCSKERSEESVFWEGGACLLGCGYVPLYDPESFASPLRRMPTGVVVVQGSRLYAQFQILKKSRRWRQSARRRGGARQKAGSLGSCCWWLVVEYKPRVPWRWWRLGVLAGGWLLGMQVARGHGTAGHGSGAAWTPGRRARNGSSCRTADRNHSRTHRLGRQLRLLRTCDKRPMRMRCYTITITNRFRSLP